MLMLLNLQVGQQPVLQEVIVFFKQGVAAADGSSASFINLSIFDPCIDYCLKKCNFTVEGKKVET